MDWHYTVGTERRGPVDEATLRGMIASGEIARDALAWNEILPDWIPVSQIAPAEKAPELAPERSEASALPTRCQRAFFWIILVNSAMAAVYQVAPQLAVRLANVLGWPMAILSYVLAILALFEQRGGAPGRLRLCVAVPFVLGLLMLGTGQFVFRNPEAFSASANTVYGTYIAVSYVVRAVELGCAIYGLNLLKRRTG